MIYVSYVMFTIFPSFQLFLIYSFCLYVSFLMLTYWRNKNQLSIALYR